MEMGVDESRYREQPASIDLLGAVVGFIGSDDPVAADRNIGRHDSARNNVEQTNILDHQVSGFASPSLGYRPRQLIFIVHRPVHFSTTMRMEGSNGRGKRRALGVRTLSSGPHPTGHRADDQ